MVGVLRREQKTHEGQSEEKNGDLNQGGTRRLKVGWSGLEQSLGLGKSRSWRTRRGGASGS